VADRRVHNSIGERFDVESTRHEDPIRRLRRRVCWGVTVLMLAGVVLLTWNDNNQVYQARPVASPHRLFEDKCEKCHHTSFHLLKRTVDSDSAAFQHSCKVCHSHDAPDHHPAAIATGMVDDCTACHKEHQGDADLTRVTDQHCIRCHGDLASAGTSGARHFSSSVTTLADHPEIALLRKTEVPVSAHGLHRVAEWLDGQWQDRGKLIFNHEVHLDPEGILVPTDHPDYDAGKKQQLKCASCHQADEEGAYMKPVTYQQHCQQCHQLHFSRQLVTNDGSLTGMVPLPHESPELIRGVLRDRLMNYIEENPGRLVPSDDLPRDPAKQVKPATAEDKWDWVEQRLLAMEDQLFSSGSVAGRGDLMYGCQRCHQTEKQVDTGGKVAWKIVKPEVPVRWLSHARFRHDRHDTKITLNGEKPFSCTECHNVNVTRAAEGSSGPMEGVLASVRAGDILMPSIQVCRQCHGGRLTADSGAASDRCTECHRYHPAEHGEAPQEAALLDYIHESIARKKSDQ